MSYFKIKFFIVSIFLVYTVYNMTGINQDKLEKIRVSENNLENALSDDTKESFSFIQESSQIHPNYISLIQQEFGRNLENERTEELVANKTEVTKLVKSQMSQDDFNYASLRQIMIWLPIILATILFVTIMSLVQMPIQKNSILYAKYGTTKTSQLSQ